MMIARARFIRSTIPEGSQTAKPFGAGAGVDKLVIYQNILYYGEVVNQPR